MIWRRIYLHDGVKPDSWIRSDHCDVLRSERFDASKRGCRLAISCPDGENSISGVAAAVCCLLGGVWCMF